MCVSRAEVSGKDQTPWAVVFAEKNKVFNGFGF